MDLGELFSHLCDLDDIIFKMSCEANLIFAIRTAMTDGSFTAETYVSGLYCVEIDLGKLVEKANKKMRDLSSLCKAMKSQEVG